ncbi:MAG: terminase, partial [Butyrivibrio sp.]|nr:terminase [Butyrivibrio sp.]
MDHDHKAYQYAAWCLDHPDYAPIYVRKQCESWINIADDLDHDAEIDLDAVERMERLLKVMIHPDLHCSVHEGLEPYAWLMITATFCTILKSAPQKTRFYITTLLEIARKNF